MKTLGYKLLGGCVLLAYALTGASVVAIELEKPTANLTEHYDVDVGWGKNFSPDASAAFAGWTNSSMAATFAGLPQVGQPKPQTAYLLALTNSSDGRFNGDFSRMVAVSFDVKVQNSASISLNFKSRRGVEWSCRVEGLPANTPTGELVHVTIPLVQGANWSAFPWEINLPDFALDKASICQFGFAIKRNSGSETCTTMNQVVVDNVKLVGPWGALVDNAVPLAWLMEHNLNESDAAGYLTVAPMLFGTTPNCSNSPFLVTIGRDDQGKMAVKWNDYKYVVFDLMESSDLNAGFTSVAGATGLVGLGTGREVQVNDDVTGARFFKVNVHPAQ